ncbi:cation diffusion facilitator family transporter [Dokdonella sp.]|uniref:cation diffusion facilitator family transporter n=1 Tax=Dokdonella sp. TaxID=2291710 RepID=UPI0031BDDA5F|nr:cation diffusion facilitator family transporter [Dokdonella sp.]
MSHEHAHRGHAPGAASGRESRLLLAFVLTTLTMVVEAAGGWLSGSLALLADAGHMLVDAVALLFAWLGARFARRPADARRSFGYARLEVLVGYTNALAQFVLVGWIALEAALRLRQPEPILSGLMLVVALAGLLVNIVVLRILPAHDHADLNTAAARLHVIGDLLGSLAAVAAAVLIGLFGWLWADALLSVGVALLILASAWRLLRRSSHILLEGVPEGIDAGHVARALRAEVADVCEVHHVHVWQLAGGYHLATLHVRLHAGADPDRAMQAVQGVLKARFRIEHATVQIDNLACPDPGCEH